MREIKRSLYMLGLLIMGVFLSSGDMRLSLFDVLLLLFVLVFLIIAPVIVAGISSMFYLLNGTKKHLIRALISLGIIYCFNLIWALRDGMDDFPGLLLTYALIISGILFVKFLPSRPIHFLFFAIWCSILMIIQFLIFQLTSFYSVNSPYLTCIYFSFLYIKAMSNKEDRKLNFMDLVKTMIICFAGLAVEQIFSYTFYYNRNPFLIENLTTWLKSVYPILRFCLLTNIVLILIFVRIVPRLNMKN
jgi:hypothetical protein